MERGLYDEGTTLEGDYMVKGIKKKEGQEAERIKGTKWPVFSFTRSLI